MFTITAYGSATQIGSGLTSRLSAVESTLAMLLLLASKAFKLRTLIVCMLLQLSFSAFSQAPQVGGVAAAPDDWLLSRGQTWHYRTAVTAQPQVLKNREPNEHEVPIVRRAREIFETSPAKALLLMSGNEIIWAGFKAPANANSPLLSFSVGKTVTSMAIGKALCLNKLSLQDSAAKYVPELQGTHLGEVTVQQLLKMSSGTASINQDSSIYSAEQLQDLQAGRISVLQVLKNPKISDADTGLFGIKRKPGEQFNYHSTDPLVLGVILNRTTGLNYAQWVEKEVLIPAGIRNEVIIGQDHFGFGAADGNIRMRLEDWARFAYWVKRNESGADCFSDYVKQATKTQINNSGVKQGKSFGGYGYLIWTENNRQSDSYWAVGYGGQRIAWNHQNARVLIAFSNLESYMDELYSLYREWSGLSDNK